MKNWRYLYTFSKNDVISKSYCALGLGLESRLDRVVVCKNTFSFKLVFEQVKCKIGNILFCNKAWMRYDSVAWQGGGGGQVGYAPWGAGLGGASAKCFKQKFGPKYA